MTYMDANNPPEHQVPAGWYDDGTGQQRWWDGTTWPEDVPPAPPQTSAPASFDSNTVAALTHVSAIFFPLLGPLIAYLVFAKDGFVRDHARQVLNFEITWLIGYVISFILVFVVVGVFTFFIIAIAQLVLHIVATVAASNGKQYRYPLTIEIITS